MSLLISLLVFLTVAFFIAAIFFSFSNEDAIKERLESFVQETRVKEEDGKGQRFIDPARLLSSVSRIFASRTFTEKVQEDMIRAAIPLKGEEFITLWICFTAFVPGLLWLLTRNWPLAALFLTIGLAGPRLLVKSRIDGRRHKLNQQLGDALVIMANALRAGFSFQQAMETVRREMPAPICNEFEWAIREMSLGASNEEALQHMAERVMSDDLDMVVSAVLIQRQVGGNLAIILDNISKTIRERARIKGAIKTLTAQGRTSGWIIGLLPVGLLFMLLILNPRFMEIMFENTTGMYMLGIAVVSEIIGIIVIRKMVDINY
ncbi:MAG: type II secretion system F family protein [Acidobacteriota bacterium]